jgi:molybdopterin synthase catalytic subunit
MGSVDVTVRLFAVLREQAGASTLDLELDEGATVADAISELRRGALSGLPEGAPFVTAVAREYVETDHELADGDELALVPPVSGGDDGAPGPPADGPVKLAGVTSEPLDVEAIRRLVVDPSCGGTVVFLGTTRDVQTLEYEAYVDMAREQIARIAAAAADEHGLPAVAVVHRIGTVPLSEPSIVVAVSAPHRGEAFAGARAILDAVKSQAPIWKQENPADGPPRWVQGTLPVPEPRVRQP